MHDYLYTGQFFNTILDFFIKLLLSSYQIIFIIQQFLQTTNIMSTTVQTKANNFIQLNGQVVPINIGQCGIKCLQCNQSFTIQQMKQHITTHVNPKYIRVPPLSKVNIPEKININKIQDPEKLQQIWVRSILPDQVPQIQKQKKVAAKLGGAVPNIEKNVGFSGLGYVKPASDLPSDLGDTADSIEEVQQLQVRKKIKLDLVQQLINKKQIHFYNSQHQIPSSIDNRVVKPKKIDDTQTQVSDGYKMEPCPTRDELPRATPRKQNKQTYILGSKMKNPLHRPIIDTRSRRIYEPDDKSQDGSTVHPFIDSRYNPSLDPQHLMCKCCKGFYCQQCKSSVPPIYRPVPDRDGNYHFHPQQNERAVEFYREHYYRNNAHVCTHCSKDYLNERNN